MRRIPQGAGLYLAVLELVFALGWTVYAIYLPRLAASAGVVIYILMLDQAIFTVTRAEGKTTGLLFSALALATFTRMATTAGGALNDPSLAPLLHLAPML